MIEMENLHKENLFTYSQECFTFIFPSLWQKLDMFHSKIPHLQNLGMAMGQFEQALDPTRSY